MMFEEAYKQIAIDLINRGIDINSVEGSFVEKLVQMGMFDDQAIDVMNLVKDNTKPVHVSWGRGKADYPIHVMNILWGSVRATALKYIDEKCPMAWFRPMFDEKQMEEIEKEMKVKEEG